MREYIVFRVKVLGNILYRGSIGIIIPYYLLTFRRLSACHFFLLGGGRIGLQV